jgi:xanthine dehydrogenase molybdopterin binding subunit/xanthine dehydrogenase small subunit
MSSASHEQIVINGKAVNVTGAPLYQSILDFLRASGLTGSKVGCNEGDCGACTLLLFDKNGTPRAINGCLALVSSLVGREIITAEGLATPEGKLHPVQQAMIQCNGSQCGYCTPGFVCSMAEIHHQGNHDRADIADQLCGNLCRCTGYRPIREAMLKSLDEPAEITPSPISLPSPPAASSDGTATWHRPGSIGEALRLKSAHPGSSFIAGATELAVLMNKRHYRPTCLISLDGIDALKEISKTSSHWILGASAPLTDVESALAGKFPMIDHLMRLFASRQIRHRATLGGNLVTASPIGDSAPVLLALDASVRLESHTETRELPLHEFFTGYRRTVMREDEILTAVLLPRQLAGRCRFFKVSKRREMDISTVSAAFRIATDAAGTITEARLAYGGVAATPARARKTEQALIGRTLEASPEILDLLASEFSPLDDLRGSAAYRRTLIRELFRKFIHADGEDSIPPFIDHESPPASPLGIPHESATGHVTGKALYVQDSALLRGVLTILPVRATHAHARLTRLDVTRAKSAPGIHAVLTASDIPGLNNTGPARHDEPLFAIDTIDFHGQVIAAVVGESMEACRHAAGLVEIEYSPLTPILGIQQAIAAGSYHTEPHFLVRGDLEGGLAASPAILEGEMHIGGQDHFYLETQAAWAQPDGEGGVHVSSSTQHPTEVQTIVAEILGLAKNRVVVEAPRMGGGFGGKETQANAWAAICALAALVTGKSASLQLDRDDDMEATGKRHPFFAKYQVGYHPDGRLHAADIELYSDGGWSLDLSLPVTDRALFHLDNCYYIPHLRFRGQVTKTHVTSHTAFRGFGGPQGMLVIEEIIGRIASKLGLPPEEVRQRNFYQGNGGSNTTHYGEFIEDNRTARIWNELLESSDFASRRADLHVWNSSHPDTKRGLAITPVKFGISFTLKHYNQAGALVLIYADGSVQVNHGGTEMGQGLHTKILGVAMRELGLPASRIRLMHTRTDKVPNTSATAASSGSDLNGMAVADACRQLRERLAPVAAEMLDCPVSDVQFKDGHVQGSAGQSIPFESVTAAAYIRRVHLSAAGFYKTPDLQWDWSVGKGKPFHYFAFGACVSEVEIDGFSGMSRVRRVDILHDVGDSLNPAIDRGQIEGGFVQGMGWLTSEELKWNAGGKLLSHSASTYAIPAFSDAPEDFRVSLLKQATQKNTIHGSKAVGEPPFMLAISVREALRDAILAFGTSRDLILPSPLTAEAVRMAIPQPDGREN